MGNTFLTPTIIADTALLALENLLVFGKLVFRGHDKEFRKVGDTIKIRRPATFTAIEFDGDLTGEFQDITEGSVDVTLDKILTVPFEITQKQMSLDVKDLTEQVIMPAARALAQGVDALCAGLYIDIPYYQDVSGTPAVGDMSACRKVLLNNQCPIDGDLIWGVIAPDTETKYNVLDAFLHADKKGDTATVKQGIMGKLYGINWTVDQNIKTHAVGSADLAGAIDNGAGYSAGDTTLHIDTLAASDTIAKGTILEIVGNTGQYVTTAAVTLATNEGDFPIYPALNDDVLDDAVVNFHAGGAENLVFHRNAFCLATAPLVEPLGGASAAVREYNGLNLQTVFSFNHNALKNVGTMSILCGVKTLQQELALRFCD